MTDTPCGDGADARHCPVFWSQNAEIERLKAELDAAQRAAALGDGKLREALAVAAAERNQLRIRLDRAYATVQSCAVGARATGNGDRERAFLDVLILLERAGVEPAAAVSGEVRVDWTMTPAEWEQLATILRAYPEVPYVRALIEAGKIPPAAVSGTEPR